MLNQCHKSTDITTDMTRVLRILEMTGATFDGRIVTSCLNRLENNVRFKQVQIIGFSIKLLNCCQFNNCKLVIPASCKDCVSRLIRICDAQFA